MEKTYHGIENMKSSYLPQLFSSVQHNATLIKTRKQGTTAYKGWPHDSVCNSNFHCLSQKGSSLLP